MKQMNINLDNEMIEIIEFLQDQLKAKSKSDAVRRGLKLAKEKIDTKNKKMTLEEMVGSFSHFPKNPNPKFKDEDDLWS